MTLIPGMVRGNHFHKVRTEFIVVHFKDQCLIAWDEGEGTMMQSSRESEGGTVIIEVQPLQAHAIKNTGSEDLVVIALSDFLYTVEDPDTFPRPLL